MLAYEMTRFRPEAELKHFGLTLPSAITITPGTVDDYERVIDGILKQGIGPTLRGLAGVLQAAEEKGARHEGILQVRRQLTPEQQEGCVRFREQLLYGQITYALMCLMGPFFVGSIASRISPHRSQASITGKDSADDNRNPRVARVGGRARSRRDHQPDHGDDMAASRRGVECGGRGHSRLPQTLAQNDTPRLK